MTERDERQALLGRLASLGWFARRAEVAATQSLFFLLDEPELREGLIGHVGALTDTDLGDVKSFHTELVHEDLARPDLEGQDEGGRPRLIVETKFGARLTAEQLAPYLDDQERRLGEGDHGALVVLVPSYRRPEAQSVLDGVVKDRVMVSAAVVTWDEWLDVWYEAASGLTDERRDAVSNDLDQLRALCQTMVALDVLPLGIVASGGEVEEREDDVRRIVAEVTRPYRYADGTLLPSGFESQFNYYRRYISGGPDDLDCSCSVGVVAGMKGEGRTPFWLRYHRDTSQYQTVAKRLMASKFAADARGDGGHLWLPLQVSPDRSGAAVLEELTEQIEQIRAVAAGAVK